MEWVGDAVYTLGGLAMTFLFGTLLRGLPTELKSAEPPRSWAKLLAGSVGMLLVLTLLTWMGLEAFGKDP